MTPKTPSTRTISAPHHLSSRIPAVFLFSLVFAMAACSQTSATTTPPTPTSTIQSTPTLAPAQCDAQFGAAYVTTLPDSTYPQTTLYAQVPLPFQTRSFDDDASGLRVRNMCSAGTADSVSAFMTQQLTLLGWQAVATASDCGRSAIPNYGRPRCWQNGKYLLFVGINSNADWAVAYVDPGFLQ